MEDSFTIRNILISFFRQLRIFIIVFLAVVSLGFLFVISSETLYHSSGSLLVKFGSDADAGINNAKKSEQISTNDRREIMQSNLDIIQSHDLLEAAINEIGVETLYPKISKQVSGKDLPVEAAINRLKRKHLIVKSGSQSNLISISVFNGNPEIASKMVTVIQDLFIIRQQEIFNKPHIDFLQLQVKKAQESLNESQQKLKDFKAKTGISSVEEELNELLRQKTSATEVALQAVNEIQSKLAQLQDEEAALLATYKESSPTVKAIRKSIEEAKRQLKERQDNLDTASEDSVLARQIEEINKRISLLEEQRGHYNSLMRQVQVDEENYKNYLQRSEEARVNENLSKNKITSISIIDNPVIQNKPSRPRKLLILAASIVAGIVTGGLVILALEVFDERLRSPEQLKNALRKPVFAAFSGKKLEKNGVSQILNNIESTFPDTPHKIIQFASSYAGEGAENLARDLAALCEERGQKVLFIRSEEAEKNLSQINFEFASRHNSSLTLIASPALITSETAKSLARMVTGSILVVKAEYTRVPVVKEAARLITSSGGNVIGAVLTGRRFYIPRWLYNLLYKAE